MEGVVMAKGNGVSSGDDKKWSKVDCGDVNMLKTIKMYARNG